MGKKPFTPSSAASTALLIAVLLLTSCSSESSRGEREYAIPPSLCGTPVSHAALEPLLPGGRKISSVKSGPSGFTLCRLVIDEKIAVTSLIEQAQSGTRLMNVAYLSEGMKASSVKKEGPKYIISDSLAVGHASCSNLQKEGHELFTRIRIDHGSAGAAAMEKAITEFTDAVSTSKQCTGSNG